MINKHIYVSRISHVERSRNMNFVQSPFDSAQDDYFSNLLCMIANIH
jgi:hypothetical protein